MSAEGTWDLTIATPVGKIKAVVELSDLDGTWAGTAHGSGENVPLTDVTVDGDRITWNQAVTKPMRLNLAFDVKVDGDILKGTSKAGRLPSSKVTGERRPQRSES